MKSLQMLAHVFWLMCLAGCATLPQQTIIASDREVPIYKPLGWKFYDEGRPVQSHLPVTITPSEKTSPSEFTTAISFYANRSQIVYFPKSNKSVEKMKLGNHEVELHKANNLEATYFLAEVPYRDTFVLVSLVVAGNSSAVIDQRKRQYLEILEKLSQPERPKGSGL
jgi:hypothetical protein